MSRSRLLILCLLAGLTGCMEGNKVEPLPRLSLAKRLGEEKTNKIVADFITLAKETPGLDSKLKRQIEEKDTGTLKTQVYELIFGPSESRDRPAQKSLTLTTKDFDALAPALNTALKDNDVKAEERKELLDLLAPSRCGTLE
jgi:hypothetical protein